jgi:2-polyprenyl-3-methyl-5-hydroxy-6-metoxy-1,4-benzoquinol methylase
MLIQQALEQKSGLAVLEIGAGANPSISQELADQFDINYFIQDIDSEELRKVKGYHFTILHQSIDTIEGQYDLIISKMVLEHTPNPLSFHQNIHRLLKPDGKAIHFFATLYNIASITNVILPDFLSRRLLKKVTSRDLDQHDKFKAYYRKCTGPTQSTINFYSSLNFQIVQFIGYCGHNYFWKYPFLYSLEKAWSKLLVKRQNPWLCSNAIIEICKYN